MGAVNPEIAFWGLIGFITFWAVVGGIMLIVECVDIYHHDDWLP